MDSAPACRLRPTTPGDLDFVLALERDPENKPFIGQWTRDEHLAAIAREADREHWLIESNRGAPLGYLIAYDLVRGGNGVYVKRIVVGDKSRGIGRAALGQFCEHAFRDLDAPFVWLRVYPENARGQRSYRALGFVDFALTPERRAELADAAGPSQNLHFVLQRAPR